MDRILVLLLAIFFYCDSNAQHDIQRCHANEKMHAAAQKDSIYAITLKKFKNRKYTSNHKSYPSGVIPVHVIIVHSPGLAVGSGNNFSKAHVESQIKVLNEDFGRTNADASNTPSQFSAVNTGIQFCLATIDPDGNPTDGITRYPTTQDFDNNETTIKLATTWDHTRYMNMWSADIGGDLLGYAYFPGAGPSRDGVVIADHAFGGPGFSTSTFYNLGRTATHEVGHYLGIDHTFAGGCNSTDGFSDTPPQSDFNSGCPSHPSTSCGNSGDMFMNYMDYVYDNCMNAFTAQQSQKMNFELSNSRAGLLSSSTTNCSSIVPMSVQLNQSTNPTCFGDNNGFIQVQVSGGVSPYTYSINNAAASSSNSFSNLSAGNYTIRVTDNTGQNQSVSVTLSNPSTVNLTAININNEQCPGNNNGAIQVSGSGGNTSGAYSYSLNNINYSSQSLFQNLSPSVYQIFVSDANGCTGSNFFEVQSSNEIIVNASSLSNNNCANESQGVIQVNASGGNGSLNYRINNGTSSSSNRFINLSNGTYTIIISDSNGCTKTLTETISSPAALSLTVSNISPINCLGETASITLSVEGGTSPYRYSTSGNANDFQNSPTFNNLQAGTYSVYVQDANACLISSTITIDSAPVHQITIASQTNVECFGDFSGTVQFSVSGTVVTQYTLNNTTNTTGFFDQLTSQSYTLNILDNNGCSSQFTFEIEQESTLDVNAAVLETIKCHGDQSASISLQAIGGSGNYQYALNGSTFSNQQEYNNLAAGAYEIIVMDNAGCQSMRIVNIEEPDVLTIAQLDVQEVSCHDESSGSINIVAMGGTGVLTYSYADQTNNSGIFNNIPSGEYAILVTDQNNCTQGVTVVLDNPALLSIEIDSIKNSNCDGDPIGYIEVDGTGGTGLLTYSLDTETNNSGLFENLRDGTYSIIVTDENDCTMSIDTTILATTDINISILSQTNPSCQNIQDGSISLSANGGNGSLTFGLNGESNQSGIFENLGIDDFTVVVTDSDGCFDVFSFSLSAPDALTVENLEITPPTCNESTDGRLSIIVSGGSGTPQYNLNGFMNTTGQFGNIPSGMFELLVTDANNCELVIPIEVVEQPPVLLNVEETVDILCFGDSNGVVHVQASDGNLPYLYTLDGMSNNTGQFSNLSVGEYTILVTDNQGCTARTNVTIQGAQAITTQVEMLSNAICLDDASGSFSLSSSGNGNTYSYVLENMTNSSGQFSNLTSGTYEVTITNEIGCSTNVSVTIENGYTIDITNINIKQTSCFGSDDGTIQISASNISGITMYTLNSESNTSGNFENLSAGAYSINIIDENGCSKDTVAVVTRPEPISIFIDPCVDLNFCTSYGFDINPQGGTPPYRYSIDNGMNLQSENEFRGLIDGEYNIYIQDANNCFQTLRYTYETASVIEDDPIVQQVKLYPVPSSDVLTIDFILKSEETITFSTIDYEGKIIQSYSETFNMGRNISTIDISQYPDAAYILSIRFGQENLYYKFVTIGR